VDVDAEALRRLREGYPLTVRELAERSGISHNTITIIENSHRTANPSTIRKLAAALGVEPSELMWQDIE
jgi:transcriptional regulator with XRE-family HTH domain